MTATSCIQSYKSSQALIGHVAIRDNVPERDTDSEFQQSPRFVFLVWYIGDGIVLVEIQGKKSPIVSITFVANLPT